MRGEHAEVVMSMPARRRDQRGESVEQFERGEGELGLAAGQGLGQSVADRLVVTLPGEPRAGEGRSGAVAQQSFEAGAILGLEAHGGVQREPAAVVPAGNLRGERTVADGDPQHPAADASLHGAERGRGEIGGGMEAQRTGCVETEHAVGDAAVQVGVGVERRAKPLHETDGPAA